MSELASESSEQPDFFLAIDGGNSKTDVVLADTTGTVLGYARGPGSSPHHLGLAGSIELLDDLVAKAVGGGTLPVDRVEVFLAGADLPVEVEQLTARGGGPRLGAPLRRRQRHVRAATGRRGTRPTRRPEPWRSCAVAGINCVGRTGGRAVRAVPVAR